MTSKIKVPIVVGTCASCGKIKEVERREFSDNGSPISQQVCYACMVAAGLWRTPTCQICNRNLIYHDDVWICSEHEKQDIVEFPNTRMFTFVRVEAK